MLVERMPKNKRILLVDDCHLSSKIVTEFLNENGYETEAITSGEEAVEKSCGSSPPDLILIDIELAGEMDGIDAARIIIKQREIPIVFLTANTSKEIINKVKEVKAYGFVLKGMDKSALLSTVEMAIKLYAVNDPKLMFDRFFENSANELYLFYPESLKFAEKESILDAIINSTRDAIVMLDSRGNVTLWNSAAEKIFGYSCEEILGKDMHRMLVSEESDSQAYTKDIKHFGLMGEDNPMEKTIEKKARHKDGREIDIEIALSYLRIMGNLNAIGIIRDIGERKQARLELEKSHKQYLELTENAPIGILICDQKGNITYVNEKSLEIIGSPGSEETKKINLLTFPSLVRYSISKKLEECLQNNEPSVHEMKYESKWGKKVWMRLHMKPLTDRNIVTGAQIIMDDITEKKHLEEELYNLSITDYLTNIYNHRFFIKKLDNEIERVQRGASNRFSLSMLDIDHFKRINDSFGHNAGDLVLKSAAEIIKNRIRKIDYLARWGGEEFMILLVDTPVDRAVILIEELRESISKMNIPGIDRVTASFGVVGYCSGDTSDILVQRADKMMYKAKAAGRNCIRY